MDEETCKRFLETPDGALLGKNFLEKYKGEYPWKVGETYKLRQLGGVSITFVGSFECDNTLYNTIILAGRRYLQEINDKLGVANQIYIKIDDPENAEAVMAAVDTEIPKQFPFKTNTRDQRSFLTSAVEDMRDVIDFSYLIMIVTLGVVLVAVANTVSMATRDRVQEFGILRSLGFRRGHILWLVLAESLVLTLVGGGLGILVALSILNLVDLQWGMRVVNIQIHLTTAVAVAAVAVTLAVGLLGGLLPAVGASRIQIVTSLRNVD